MAKTSKFAEAFSSNARFHYLCAELEGANLEGVLDLTQEQLDAAEGDDRTVLPDGLTLPAH